MNIKIDNSSYYLSSLSVEKSKHKKTFLEDYITLNTASQNPAGASIFYDNLEYIAMAAGVEEGGRYNQTFYSPFDYKCRQFDFPDWHIDGTPEEYANMLYYALNSIGLRCFVHVGDMSSFKKRAEVSFSGDTLYSAIRKIQEAFGCKMWLEDIMLSQEQVQIHCYCLHFSEYSLAFSIITLCSPANIKVPTVNGNKMEHFNRFYVFGSSRNITQDYANVNNVATKRLTLNPSIHPEGYLDYSNGGPVYSKVLQFDDVYPSATDLVVMNLRSRLMYEISEDGEKIVIGEKDGEPVYSQIAIWYCQIKRLVDGQYIDFEYNDSEYDKETNPEGMRLRGYVPSIHFNSGPLAGREFELIYHKDGKTIPEDASGNPPFVIFDGDFEIKYIEEGGFKLPAITGLIPTENDLVVLFNVKMPQAYETSAQERLKEAALEYIKNNYIQLDNVGIPYVDEKGSPLPVDKNEYTAQLCPVKAYGGVPLQTPFTELNIIPTE